MIFNIIRIISEFQLSLLNIFIPQIDPAEFSISLANETYKCFYQYSKHRFLSECISRINISVASCRKKTPGKMACNIEIKFSQKVHYNYRILLYMQTDLNNEL